MSRKKILLIGILLLAVIAAGVYYFLPKEVKVVRKEYSPGEYFVTNVKDTNRLLKATVVLVLDTDNKKVLEEVSDRNTEIRDTITTILRSQELETLQDTDLTVIKTQMIFVLNGLLESDHIVGILFSDWAIQ